MDHLDENEKRTKSKGKKNSMEGKSLNHSFTEHSYVNPNAKLEKKTVKERNRRMTRQMSTKELDTKEQM